MLKEAMRRLGRYEPVSSNDSSRHRGGRRTISGSTPLLQFNNISFRISRVHDSKDTEPRYFCGNDVSHCAAASRNHCLQSLVYIVHRKCDVTEPAPVRGRQFGLDQLSIAENLKCQTIIAIAGQS